MTDSAKSPGTAVRRRVNKTVRSGRTNGSEICSGASRRPPSAAELQAISDGFGSGLRNGPVELREAGLNQRDALLEVADDARLWRTSEGETFATVWHDGHTEHHAVKSRGFRDWWLSELARRYLSNGRPASVSMNAVRDAINGLEARAFSEQVNQDAPLRVAEYDGQVYIDTGRRDWSAFEVTKAGWTVVPSPPTAIRRSRRTGVLPIPATRADFAPLRALLDRLGDREFALFVAWCLGALWPAGPYPILILGGEQGSGKSTLARLAQRIVDPVAGDLLQPPGDDRDLIAAAKHGRVLGFDNISGITSDLADSLCRLATGAEIGGRALFTNHDSASFRACRPIILNGIPDLAARGDLADRSIVIRLEHLDRRITERDFWREVDACLPAITAALLDAMVSGLARIEEVPTPDCRMADFARLVVAAERALPWETGEFLAAYDANQSRIITSIIEGDLVAAKIVALVTRHGDWSGLVSELYNLFTAEVPSESRRSSDWPGNARWFSERLTRAAPALRGIGIDVSTRVEARGRRVHIRKLAPLAPAETDRNAASGANGAIPLVSRPSSAGSSNPAVAG